MSVRRVVIIGATSGIGLEVAKGYLKAGWQVGIAGRREEELEKLLLTAPGQVCAQALDVTREDAPHLLQRLIDKLGGMDLFLLSSGIGKQNLSLTPDIELQTAATNVEGFIRMVIRTFGSNQFHCRNQRAGFGSRLFCHQTFSEYLHRGPRPIGTHEPATHCLHRHPPRICSHPATERRQIPSADERFQSSRTHHQCTQQKETNRHHRPALSSTGILLETHSQMVMGTSSCPQLRTTHIPPIIFSPSERKKHFSL